jgi:hypothetical protein
MNQDTSKALENDAAKERKSESLQQGNLVWEKPILEDVSEQVTAQPYIRFT